MRVRRINRALRVARELDNIAAYDPGLSTHVSIFVRDRTMWGRVQKKMDALATENFVKVEKYTQDGGTLVWKLNLGSYRSEVTVFFVEK